MENYLYKPPRNIRHRHHPRHLHHWHRREDGSNRQQTTIIIAVCVGVACTVVTIFLIRAIYRMCARRPSRSAPLPPVQPLAHDRERRLAQLDAWQDSSQHLAAPIALGSTGTVGGSRTSLLTKEADSTYHSQEPSRHTSFAPSEHNDDTTALASASPMDVSLPIPNPTFHHNSASSSSLGFNSDTEIASNSPTPPLTPSLSHTPFPAANPGSRPDSPSSSTPSPARTPSGRKPRPVSTMSTSSTFTTRSARNTIRGTPHGPHSNIQIILPAPLAPELYPYASNDDRSIVSGRHSSYYDPTAVKRKSLADKWAPIAVRSETPASRGQRRSSISSESRPSFTSSSNDHSMSSSGHRPPRRVSSTPHGFSHAQISSFQQSAPPSAFQPFIKSVPPVPRIPSVYNIPTPSDVAQGAEYISTQDRQHLTSVSLRSLDESLGHAGTLTASEGRSRHSQKTPNKMQKRGTSQSRSP